MDVDVSILIYLRNHFRPDIHLPWSSIAGVCLFADKRDFRVRTHFMGCHVKKNTTLL